MVFVGVGTAKLLKFATLLSRSSVTFGQIVTEPANSYDVMHGRYSITWPPLSLET